ncbi:hypothetical protein [Pseudomonas sp. NPDC088444]|uniref:hypothetical protein n=1 Tax=Pseudomonas sp. NPDC088444 TaxID=3364456 RepID=UPI00384AFB54
MTKRTDITSGSVIPALKLEEAVEAYVAKGGIISVVPEGETRHSNWEAQPTDESLTDATHAHAKIEQLKGLVAKGAGVTALQYSLRMNRKEIKRLASENGVKIHYSRPVRGSRPQRSRDTLAVDDTVAGHAMHYSALGYTVPEIAQLLELAVRDVWNIGKAYRFEFKNAPKPESNQTAAPMEGEQDVRQVPSEDQNDS